MPRVCATSRKLQLINNREGGVNGNENVNWNQNPNLNLNLNFKLNLNKNVQNYWQTSVAAASAVVLTGSKEGGGNGEARPLACVTASRPCLLAVGGY